MSIKIGKIDIARRQLETAINLFFYDRDVVSIHTLTAAAFNILQDMSTNDGRDIKTLRSVFLKRVKEGSEKHVINKIREAENFFKHADKDPYEYLEFNSKQTEYMLWDAVTLYAVIAGENTSVLQLFYYWFMASYPDIFTFTGEQKRLQLEAGMDLNNISKKEYFELMLPRISRLDKHQLIGA